MDVSFRPSFFFDQLQPRTSKEQMADDRQDQVPLEGAISPTLKVIETQQALFVLKASLDVPAREGHM